MQNQISRDFREQPTTEVVYERPVNNESWLVDLLYSAKLFGNYVSRKFKRDNDAVSEFNEAPTVRIDSPAYRDPKGWAAGKYPG